MQSPGITAAEAKNLKILSLAHAHSFRWGVMEWYYASAGQRAGPIEESELRTLYAAGTIGNDTLIWRAGMPDWQPLRAAQPWPMQDAPLPYGFCTECGRQFDPADLLAFGASRVCAGCKDVFFQRVREQGAAVAADRSSGRYGGFWIRFLARVIDGLILSAVFLILVAAWALLVRPRLLHPEAQDFSGVAIIWAGLGVIYLISAAVSIIYEAWFLAHRGGTPGKLALGLRVVRSNGSKLTWGRSVGRAFAYMLDSVIPFAIGFIIAAFDNEKRALHDLICDTRVVHKSA